MFIYNVTVNIDPSVHDQWLSYMTSTHIPDVLKTGCFIDNRLCKLLNVEDEGFTYSIQYTFLNMEDFDRYQKEFAPALQAEHKEKFKDKFVAFRTLLEII